MTPKELEALERRLLACGPVRELSVARDAVGALIREIRTSWAAMYIEGMKQAAQGMLCPCGGGTCVPVPTCPACHEQWVDDSTGEALDAATLPHVFAERRRRIEARHAGAADMAEGERRTHALSPDDEQVMYLEAFTCPVPGCSYPGSGITLLHHIFAKHFQEWSLFAPAAAPFPGPREHDCDDDPDCQLCHHVGGLAAAAPSLGPRAPEELVDALQDLVHGDGPGRAARSVRAAASSGPRTDNKKASDSVESLAGQKPQCPLAGTDEPYPPAVADATSSAASSGKREHEWSHGGVVPVYCLVCRWPEHMIQPGSPCSGPNPSQLPQPSPNDSPEPQSIIGGAERAEPERCGSCGKTKAEHITFAEWRRHLAGSGGKGSSDG